MSICIGAKAIKGSAAKAAPPIIEKEEIFESVENTDKVENTEKVEEKPKSTRGRKKKIEQ